jgi:hypothetical protein
MSAAARDTIRIAARHAIRGRAVGIDLSAPMPELARRIAVEKALGNSRQALIRTKVNT